MDSDVDKAHRLGREEMKYDVLKQINKLKRAKSVDASKRLRSVKKDARRLALNKLKALIKDL